MPRPGWRQPWFHRDDRTRIRQGEIYGSGVGNSVFLDQGRGGSRGVCHRQPGARVAGGCDGSQHRHGHGSGGRKLHGKYLGIGRDRRHGPQALRGQPAGADRNHRLQHAGDAAVRNHLRNGSRCADAQSEFSAVSLRYIWQLHRHARTTGHGDHHHADAAGRHVCGRRLLSEHAHDVARELRGNRSGRGSERTSGHSLRSKHHGRRDQDHDEAARL